MPRIAHLISAPAGIGGAERVLEAIVAPARPDWEQVVVNVSGDNPALAAACAPCEVRAAGPGPALLGGRRTAALALREFRPDVVHSHLPLATIVLATLRRRGERVRVATHEHGDHFVVSGRRLAARLDRAAGARVDCQVACSEAVRRFLLADYGYPEDFVRTIVNGWAGEPILDAPRAPAPTVVSVGNFRAQKNHRMLLHAFAIVRERLPDARLLLVGGGPLEEEVRDLAGSLGLGSAVELTGYVDDVWGYLFRSHVFALSSDYEPLGIAVLEGMAAGLPVVATAVGGVPELVRPGVNGELVEPGDAEAMAGALTEMLSSPELARSLGEAGRAAAAGHTAARMVDRYFALYEELLSANGD